MTTKKAFTDAMHSVDNNIEIKARVNSLCARIESFANILQRSESHNTTMSVIVDVETVVNSTIHNYTKTLKDDE